MNRADRSYFRRLWDFWLSSGYEAAWLAMGLPALYFLQTLLHEGAHAVTALADGGSPKLAPFPHLTLDNRFLNGVTMRASGFIATPQFLDLGLIVLLTLVYLFWPIRNRFVKLLLRLWFLGVSVDLLYNTARELVGGHNPYADWSRFQDTLGIPDAGMIALTWAIWVFVFSHFVWLYFSAWHRDPPEPETAGFWDYRWVAVVYGVLSLAAVVISLAVNDPEIVKLSFAFIGPLLLQVASVVWCSIYIAQTARRA